MTRSDLIPPSPSEAEHKSVEPDEAETELFGHDDPFDVFAQWLALAKEREPRDANAMALATVDGDGMPDVRMVLLKGFDGDGFVFYTNTESAKGAQLTRTPNAALCFHWKSINRQIRVRGVVTPVSDEEADAYFAQRARDSRIGAWASLQSQPMDNRFALEKRVASHAAKFGLGAIPRPPYWSGYRLAPLAMEFWRERAFRLHDRRKFTRSTTGSSWDAERLFP